MKKLFNIIIFVSLVFSISSCFGKTPIKQYNRAFLSEYGDDVEIAKKKHYKIQAQNKKEKDSYNEEEYMAQKICGIAELESGECYYSERAKKYFAVTDLGLYILQPSNEVINRQRERDEYNELHKYDILLSENDGVYYLRNNNDKFLDNHLVSFEDIDAPLYKEYRNNLGAKDYDYVNNIELQESVDYITVINRARALKRRELIIKQRIAEKALEEQSLSEKAVDSAADAQKTFSNLVGKFFGGKDKPSDSNELSNESEE